jgi:hypothetical protein
VLAWLVGLVLLVPLGYVAGGLGMWEGMDGGRATLALALGLIWTAVCGLSMRDQHRK